MIRVGLFLMALSVVLLFIADEYVTLFEAAQRKRDGLIGEYSVRGAFVTGIVGALLAISGFVALVTGLPAW